MQASDRYLIARPSKASDRDEDVLSFDVCVIGAGLSGLSTALSIQKLIPRVKVTIIADTMGRDTNTPVTTGLFVPAPFNMADVDRNTANEWLVDGWKHHHKLATSDESAKSGNTLMTGQCYWYHDGDHLVPDLVLDYRTLSRKEMDDREIRYAKGCEFTTVHVDLQLYLPWLMKQVRENGANILIDRVFSLHQMYGQYDVVVNCVGMRCREVLCDQDLTHTKGSVVQMECPSMDTFIIAQDDISIVPNLHSGLVDVGVRWQPESQVKGVDDDNVWLIKRRAIDLAPELEPCPVVKSWTEKRPVRNNMLLKMDTVDCGGPLMPVVHNIGHGMDNVTVAWGAGCQAAHLVLEFKRKTRPFPWVMQPFGTFA